MSYNRKKAKKVLKRYGRKIKKLEKRGEAIIKPYAKEAKQIGGMVETGFIGAGGSMALGALGGSVAQKGQAGIQSAFGMYPTVGKMVGAGMMMGGVRQLEKSMQPKVKKKKRRKKKKKSKMVVPEYSYQF